MRTVGQVKALKLPNGGHLIVLPTFKGTNFSKLLPSNWKIDKRPYYERWPNRITLDAELSDGTEVKAKAQRYAYWRKELRFFPEESYGHFKQYDHSQSSEARVLLRAKQLFKEGKLSVDAETPLAIYVKSKDEQMSWEPEKFHKDIRPLFVSSQEELDNPKPSKLDERLENRARKNAERYLVVLKQGERKKFTTEQDALLSEQIIRELEAAGILVAHGEVRSWHILDVKGTPTMIDWETHRVRRLRKT